MTFEELNTEAWEKHTGFSELYTTFTDEDKLTWPTFDCWVEAFSTYVDFLKTELRLDKARSLNTVTTTTTC
ncbi:MAG: hypothetical protein WCL08_00165 [Verrucomicrobiota bacterium]